jgi:HEPN domain-containing protein
MSKSGIFSKEYAHELMSIAYQDLASADFLAQQQGVRVENVFLLAQQSLEKALKAVLCWHNQPIPFIHEIGILVTKLEAVNVFAPFGYDLNSLSEFATIRRYLEGKESWDHSEILGILEQVRAAVQWSRDQLQINTTP